MHDQPHRPQPRRLTRSADRGVGGVCAGIAEYFGVDPTLVRIGFVLLAILSIGFGALLLYALLWAIMPAPGSDVGAGAGPSSGGGALLLGIILVVIGLSMAFQGLQLFAWLTSSFFRFGWPAVFIAIGLLIVIASRRREA